MKISQEAREAAMAWLFSTPHGSRHVGADAIGKGNYDSHSLVMAMQSLINSTLKKALAAMPATSAPSMDGYQSAHYRGVDIAKNIIRQLIEE